MKVLMVVTSHDNIEQTQPTGLWLEEFAVPYNEFRANGIQVVVASIQGGRAPVDPRSKPTPQQEKLWGDAITALSNTMPIAAASPMDYDAVFLPGGHGTMFDLPRSTHLTNILEQMAADKIVAAVCHGPAAFVTAPGTDRKSIVSGKTITSFTDAEELAAGMETKMPFLLESTLRRLGAKFVAKPNWSDHVEIDGNLITGQNPQSSLSTARAVIVALRAKAHVRTETIVD